MKTKLTRKQAEKFLKQAGGNKAYAAQLAGVGRSSFYRALQRAEGPEPVEPVAAPTRRGAPTGGIQLSNVQVFDRKPAASVKNLLHTLTAGLGYPITALSDQWGVSPETIRKHAKAVGCLKYAEVAPGEFAAVIVKP